jgi:hypothetical protein
MQPIRPHGDCFVCLCDMSDGDGVLLLPCCNQCIHEACLSECIVSARLSRHRQHSSAAEMVRDLCPACKQPIVLQPTVAAAVDMAVTAALKDAAAAEQIEIATKARRDAEERELAKIQRRKELLSKFTSAPTCCVCVPANRSQSTKYFMHAFGNMLCPHSLSQVVEFDPSAAKFTPVECAHAYKNDSHLGASFAFDVCLEV